MARNNTAFVINGYSYADAKCTFNGIELPGVTSFDFQEAQAKTNNYGMGKNAVSRSRGIVEQSGSIEMDYDTENLISVLSPDGKLHSIPPGLMVTSLEKFDGGKEVVTLPFFEFKGDGVGGSQGDDNLTNSVDVIFGSMQKTSF